LAFECQYNFFSSEILLGNNTNNIVHLKSNTLTCSLFHNNCNNTTPTAATTKYVLFKNGVEEEGKRRNEIGRLSLIIPFHL